MAQHLNVKLIERAQASDIIQVKELVESGAEINYQDDYGWTAAQCAANNGNSEMLQYLTSKGCDVNISNKDGRTPLLHAGLNGFLEIVKHLVGDCGAYVSVRDRGGQNVKDWAQVCDHKEILAFLLDHESSGQTPRPTTFDRRKAKIFGDENENMRQIKTALESIETAYDKSQRILDRARLALNIAIDSDNISEIKKCFAATAVHVADAAQVQTSAVDTLRAVPKNSENSEIHHHAERVLFQIETMLNRIRVVWAATTAAVDAKQL